MHIPKRIAAVETLIEEILAASPKERLMIYAAIKLILLEIEEYVEEEEENLGLGNYGIYAIELSGPLETLVGLDDNGHPESQNLSWARGSIHKLRSVHCFNIE